MNLKKSWEKAIAPIKKFFGSDSIKNVELGVHVQPVEFLYSDRLFKRKGGRLDEFQLIARRIEGDSWNVESHWCEFSIGDVLGLGLNEFCDHKIWLYKINAIVFSGITRKEVFDKFDSLREITKPDGTLLALDPGESIQDDKGCKCTLIAEDSIYYYRKYNASEPSEGCHP